MFRSNEFLWSSAHKISMFDVTLPHPHAYLVKDVPCHFLFILCHLHLLGLGTWFFPMLETHNMIHRQSNVAMWTSRHPRHPRHPRHGVDITLDVADAGMLGPSRNGSTSPSTANPSIMSHKTLMIHNPPMNILKNAEWPSHEPCRIPHIPSRNILVNILGPATRATKSCIKHI